MVNWIDRLDEDTREYDNQIRAGAERYDREVMGCCGDDDEDDGNDDGEQEDEDE